MTQMDLAGRVGVTDKAVSKWETGKGLPDITLLQPLAAALDTSVAELMNGRQIVNKNRGANLLRTKFYVCPLCGNIIYTLGETAISCCGITLPPLEGEPFDGDHSLTIEDVENEHFLTLHHPMTKDHFISFLAFVTCDRIQFVKLYPEGSSATRLQLRGRGIVYAFCNKHGLMQQRR